MPPTRWKQEEEEEGKGNHSQTPNSLTPRIENGSSQHAGLLGSSCPFPHSAILHCPVSCSIPGWAGVPGEERLPGTSS